jgi:chemotaxis response regulator CheB
MTEQRIVLANGSRLLRDMLKRIITKSDKLEIIREVSDQKDLPAVIEHTNPEWVILSLSFDEAVPAWVDGFVANHPSVRFMGIASDGSTIKMKWLEIHEQDLNSLSLRELLQILEGESISP